MPNLQEQLNQACTTGTMLRLSPDLDGRLPSADADLPTVEGTWLLDLLAQDCGHPRGLHLQGARIIGEIDWSWQTLTRPLRLESCLLLDDDLNLQSLHGPALTLSRCRTHRLHADEVELGHGLNLDGTHLDGLAARDARLVGGLSLSRGFTCTGQINLAGATIGGNLDLAGATLTNPGGYTLIADGAHIAGSALFNNGFASTGHLHLSAATIGLVLNMAGATLTNPDDYTLTADSAHIAGSTFLNDGFTSTGQLHLNDATIGGNLDLAGAVLDAPGGDALAADRARVTGSVFLNNGFTSTGRIRLPGTTIGGQLGLAGAVLTNPGRDTLAVDGARITGSVLLSHGFTSTGRISLASAAIGGDLDLHRAALSRPGGHALDLEGTRIDGCLRMQEAARSPEGGIHLTRTRTGELRDDPSFWPEPGTLVLTGLVYDRLGTPFSQDPGLRLDWLRRTPEHSPQPYRQLATVLRDAGHRDAARTILIAERDDERRRGRLPRRHRAWNWFLSATIGHGYRPARPIRFLLPLYALSVLFVSLATTAGLFVPTGDNVPRDAAGRSSLTSARCTHDYPCLIPTAYAAENLVPVLDLHQASLWQPDTTSGPGQALRAWLYATTAIGWVSTSLIVAALTGITAPKD
jgi:hypothetical protein